MDATEREHRIIYEFALKAYGSNKRSNGCPYIIHIEGILAKLIDLYRVEDIKRDEKELKVQYRIPVGCLIDLAMLHDVVEDTSYSFSDIEKTYREGIERGAIAYVTEKEVQDTILPTLRLLTHDKKIPYSEYIHAISESKTASIIKLLDLSDNLNLSSLAKMDAHAYERSVRYVESFEEIERKQGILSEAGDIRKRRAIHDSFAYCRK